MNAALKQRLVGAIVLVALAVIFLPMLLDGSGARERFDVAMDIPDRPQAPQSRIDDDAAAAGEAGPDAGARDDELARAGDGGATGAPEPAATADSESAESGAPESSAAAEAEPAGSGATETPATGEGADDAGQPGPGAWVVQVGSFGREANALVLRDRLREAGYEAFVEEGEGDDQTWWRVRVGPVSERGQAEELRAALERERGGDSALVMAYP